jgi:hypothetical protein
MSTEKENLASRGVRPLDTAMVVAAVALVAMAVVPLQPTLPSAVSLDDSWTISLNQAIERRLRFGEDLIFTFGPYASIFTKHYSPATLWISILGGACLATGYGLAIVLLARESRSAGIWMLAFAIVLASLTPTRNGLLFVYLPLASLSAAACLARDEALAPRVRRNGAWALMPIVAVFGLLPLIKGSLLAPTLMTMALLAAFLAVKRLRVLAPLVLVVPVAACAVFWVGAGQRLAGLTTYFGTQLDIISGYTEAMSSGDVGRISREVLVYVVIAALSVAAALYRGRGDTPRRTVVVLSIALFYFISFKAAFVRHDSHAETAAEALVLGACLVALVVPRWVGLGAALLCLVGWVAIDTNHFRTSRADVQNRLSGTVSGAMSGIGRLLSAKYPLEKPYDAAVRALAAKCDSVPVQVDGTIDVYSFGQSCVFALGGHWSPRPVFQSYSAYTPRLAEINRDHLRGKDAPTRLLFRIEPIDRRLPALEDGLSWPEILNSYSVHSYDGEYLVFARSAATAEMPDFERIAEIHARFGQTVDVPRAGDAYTFAQFEVEPTLPGKVANVLYKPTQLKITLNLEGGETKEYRFIPTMAKVPLLLSPLVDTTEDFYLLATGSRGFVSGRRVLSLSVSPKDGHATTLWQPEYTVSFLARTLAASKPVPRGHFDETNPMSFDEFRRLAEESCDGSIDGLNGSSPVPMKVRVFGDLRVDGWTAVSAKDGTLPDQVLVALVSPTRKEAIVVRTEQRSREDVAAHFKQPSLAKAGFSARIDTSMMSDTYALSLLQVAQGRTVVCKPEREVRIMER